MDWYICTSIVAHDHILPKSKTPIVINNKSVPVIHDGIEQYVDPAASNRIPNGNQRRRLPTTRGKYIGDGGWWRKRRKRLVDDGSLWCNQFTEGSATSIFHTNLTRIASAIAAKRGVGRAMLVIIVSVSKIFEEMNLLRLREECQSQTMNGGIAPTFEMKTTSSIQVFEIVPVLLIAVEIQSSDFKVGPEMTSVPIIAMVVLSNPGFLEFGIEPVPDEVRSSRWFDHHIPHRGGRNSHLLLVLRGMIEQRR
jgi:hypothetical protein